MSPRPKSRFTSREPYLGVDLDAFAHLPGFVEEIGPRLRNLHAAGCESLIVPLSLPMSDTSVIARNNVHCQGIVFDGAIEDLSSRLDELLIYRAHFIIVDIPPRRDPDDEKVLESFANEVSKCAAALSPRGMKLLLRNRRGDTRGGSANCRLARAVEGSNGLAGYCVDIYALWGDGTPWDLFVAEAGHRIHLVEIRDEWNGKPVAFGTGDLPFAKMVDVLDRIPDLHGIYFAASRSDVNLMDIAITSLGSVQDLVDHHR